MNINIKYIKKQGVSHMLHGNNTETIHVILFSNYVFWFMSLWITSNTKNKPDYRHIIKITSGGSRIFPWRRGCVDLVGGVWIPEVATFHKICMSKRKNRVPLGRGRAPGAPPGSANDNCLSPFDGQQLKRGCMAVLSVPRWQHSCNMTISLEVLKGFTFSRRQCS